MLSDQSSEILGSLLLSLGECEKQVETSRQDLCSHPHFDVYSLFTTFQSRNNGKITWNELKTFLARRSMAITREYLELLIAQYDSNLENSLTLANFKPFVLSRENPELALEAESRKMLPSLYIESLMARHIELECNWQGRLQLTKRKLFLAEGFSPIESFRVLSGGENSQINLTSLLLFLRKFYPELENEDGMRIIRRIDTNNDLLVNYQDFLSFVLPVNQKNHSKFRDSHTAFGARGLEKRLKTSRGSRPISRISPQKEKHEPDRNVSAKQIACHLIIDEPALVNKEIIKVFSQQVEIDLNVEKAKVKLTNHLDFSFDELIKLIDRHNKGYVTSSDLEGTLRDLHIPFHKDEVQLLIKHFTKDDKISYRQTKDLFVPITWKDRKRVADFKDEGYRIFSADTLNHLIELFKSSLKAQVMLEKVRNSLQSELKSQLFQVFHEIDREKTGTVSLNNLRNYLADGKLNYREGEVRLLYKRYAKSYHKEITYSDFLEELTPKLAH